jgi:hypothetical protein
MTFSEDDKDGKLELDAKLALDSKGGCSGTFTSDAASFQILKIGKEALIKIPRISVLTGIVGLSNPHGQLASTCRLSIISASKISSRCATSSRRFPEAADRMME